jgi:predicted nucleotide-binding protein (sugar kinase/HSP70/actin superfamily)
MSQPIPLSERTLYFSGVSEHFQAVAAAYRAFGQPAEALPLTTRDSLSLGMQASRGRECLYFVIQLGDLLAKSKQPNFDPERSAMWSPDISTKCVSVNFSTRHRQIFSDHGLGALTTATPLASNNYAGFGEKYHKIADLSWSGIVAVDLLQQLQQ